MGDEDGLGRESDERVVNRSPEVLTEWARTQARERVASNVDYFHTFFSIRSVEVGTPGFVSDDLLGEDSRYRDYAPALVAELERVGRWKRAENGYVIADDDVVASFVRCASK